MNYINLLPKKELETRREERKLRLILINGTVATFLAIFFLLLVFILKIHADNNLQEIQAELAAKEVNLYQVNQLEKEVLTLNSTFKKINKFYQNQKYTTDVIKILTSYLEPEMTIQSFNFNPESGKGYILGYAKDLESLDKYRDKLKQDEQLKEIEVEILGFLKTKDVTFRLNFIYEH